MTMRPSQSRAGSRRPPSQQGGVRRQSAQAPQAVGGGSRGGPGPSSSQIGMREPTPIGGTSQIRSASPASFGGSGGGGARLGAGGGPSPSPMMGGGGMMMMGFPGGASASPTPTLSLDAHEELMKYRSVSEKRMASEILGKEGQWDPENQVYLTRQKQLQERTKRFSDLQQTVRYSPDHAYFEQGKDLEFAYPNCPAQLLKKHYTPHSKLSEVDPQPRNIEAKSKQLLKNQQERKQRGVASLLSGTTKAGGFSSQKEAEEAITSLEKELLRTATNSMRLDSTVASTAASIRPYGSRTAGSYGQEADGKENEGSDSAPLSRSAEGSAGKGVSTTTTTSGGAALPLLEEKSAGYSSLLVQLRKQKTEVQQHHKDLSTIRSILTMDGSADLKRTITRMFADPKNADAISKEEYDRREQMFDEERKRTIQHQTSLLKSEREVMEKELAQLQM